MKKKILILILLIVVAAAAAYFFLLGGELPTEEFAVEEPVSVTRRIKVEPPPELDAASKKAPKKVEVAAKDEPEPKAEQKTKVETKTETKAKAKTKVAKKPDTIVKPEQLSNMYVINMASFLSRKDADAFRSEIAAVGYNAYVTEFVKDNTTWHRVRVGFYPTRSEAKKYSKILSKKFNVQSAWLSRATETEVARHSR